MTQKTRKGRGFFWGAIVFGLSSLRPKSVGVIILGAIICVQLSASAIAWVKLSLGAIAWVQLSAGKIAMGAIVYECNSYGCNCMHVSLLQVQFSVGAIAMGAITIGTIVCGCNYYGRNCLWMQLS